MHRALKHAFCGIVAALMLIGAATLLPEQAQAHPSGCWYDPAWHCSCSVWRTCAGTCNDSAGQDCEPVKPGE